MELDLKFLAPYLPYELILYDSEQGKDFQMSQLSVEGFVGYDTNSEAQCCIEYCKPYLRPLSQLTEEIEHNGDKIKIQHLPEVKTNPGSEYSMAVGYVRRGELKKLLALEYWFVEILFKYHFDVFGLIDQNLARPKG